MLSPDISLQDLETFVEISRLRSLKEAARQMDRLPSSISKVISNLERKLGTVLFLRSPRGMELTPEGTNLYRTARKMMNIIGEIQVESPETTKRLKTRKVYSIGSISFLCSRLVAPSLEYLKDLQKENRLRIAEFSHNQIMLYATRGTFEIALHIGPMELTKAWHSVEIGKMHWGLYGNYGHPLGTLCTSEQALKYPFIVPTGWNEMDGFVDGADNCPEPLSNRIHGNEATTAETALEIAQLSNELTFIPSIAASLLVRSKRVQEIRVHDWPTVHRPVYLSVRSDKVSKKMFDQLQTAFTKVLREV